MVAKHVRIYIEGGSSGNTADSDFRRGWKKFLNDLHNHARANGYRSLEVVRCNGRSNAFRKFQSTPTVRKNDLCVLLVDAETPVPDHRDVWDVVSQLPGDKWIKPNWATESHLYLMVETFETWLLTDPAALRSFFNSGFDEKQLPTTRLEERPKAEVENALKKATQNSPNGPYHHGQGHAILEYVSPSTDLNPIGN